MGYRLIGRIFMHYPAWQDGYYSLDDFPCHGRFCERADDCWVFKPCTTWHTHRVDPPDPRAVDGPGTWLDHYNAPLCWVGPPITCLQGRFRMIASGHGPEGEEDYYRGETTGDWVAGYLSHSVVEIQVGGRRGRIDHQGHVTWDDE